MSKPMPPIWWYKSLQKLILDMKKKYSKSKKCFCKLFFSSSPFLQSTDTMKKKKKENNYQQRLKKTEKTKLERILIQIKIWKQKKS